MSLVAEIILPLPVKSNFDYRVPPELADKARPGMRALVVFGRNKIYTGVIKRTYTEVHPEKWEALKPLDEFPDEEPALREWQLQIFEWISFYYFCTEGEVLKAALPTGLKLESAMRVEAGDIPEFYEGLSEREIQLMERLLAQPSLSLQEVSELWGIINPGTQLRRMAARGHIRLVHRLQEGYKPKTETWLDIADPFRDEEALHEAFESLSRAPRQEEALMLIAAEYLGGRMIARAKLRARLEGGDSAVRALIEKGIVKEVEVEVDRVADLHFKSIDKEITYTDEQVAALQTIRDLFKEHSNRPVLLHGVTGSGKTHLYIDLIRETLEAGKQVLYLLPEIALTQQIIDKVKSEFGGRVGVYHSRFNEHERVEIWRKVLSGEFDVVIGVRSAIFLPFENPGLIVVDEEHDTSFKQHEPNPRYHARDVAVYMAAALGCDILLGSATPSFETLYNARHGRYGLAEMKNRATDSKLPEIEIVDLREQRKKRLINGHFSKPLLDNLSQVLERKEQAILFQNRRGFVPVLQCTHCGHSPRCINCDITLTYHKARKQLRCHYCGYADYQVDKCEHCGQYDLRQKGLGTEKIEEDLKAIFPNARIARMDLDTTRTRHGFLKLIRSFEQYEIDILVGTQMVSKGLDFENVTLVGVMDADLMLSFQDFRAYEHSYQLLTQVSGRAGRAQKPGRVIIQSYDPENPVLRLLGQDYGLFFDLEMRTREELGYPPYARLIRMEIRHKNQLFLESQAEVLRKMLLPVFGKSMLGPVYPYITRLRNEYRQHVLFKLGRKVSAKHVRDTLHQILDRYYSQAPQKTLRVVVDVDPV